MEMERCYRDRLFRMVFREKKNLLSLYNAVNGTHYTNEEDLEINTLENAIYMNMKNDIFFVFDFYLNLYEHQSSFNPNMPLRNLFYLAKLLQGMVEEKKLYSSSIIKIPTPLKEFLLKYRAEAIEVCIFEYDEEAHMNLVREEGREEGRAEGREEGRAEGEWQKLISLVRKKLAKGLTAMEIAEILEEEIVLVEKIVKILEQNSDKSEKELIRLVMG